MKILNKEFNSLSDVWAGCEKELPGLDWEFIKTSLMQLLPIIVVLSYLFGTNHYGSDFVFHESYIGNGAYPQFLGLVMRYMPDRHMDAFFISLSFIVVLPYILVRRITNNKDASFVYLYGTGVPMVMSYVGFIPQGIIQTLMLASIYWPPSIIALIILGPFIHEFWWMAAILVFGMWTLKYIDKNWESIKTRLPYGH